MVVMVKFLPMGIFALLNRYLLTLELKISKGYFYFQILLVKMFMMLNFLIKITQFLHLEEEEILKKMMGY